MMTHLLLAFSAAAALGALALRVRERRSNATGGAGEPDLSTLVAHLPGLAYRARLDRSVEFASAGCGELTGYTPEELEVGGVGLDSLVHPQDRPEVEAAVAEAIRWVRPFQITYRVVLPDGATKWVWEKGRVIPADDGGPGALEGFLIDATERKLAEERLRQEALYDKLTGLANRAVLMERLGLALRRRRRQPSFALLTLDLDRFKLINESLGHERGDRVLRITAQRLQACLRQEDTVARLGGDEFAILLDDVAEIDDAVRVARRIIQLAALPIYLGEDEVFTSASIGIAASPSGYGHPEEPMRDAEIALNRAKAAGGGCYELFDREMHDRAVAQLRIETDLRRALDRGELFLLYQPIIGLDDGRVRGFEALLRWQHPERGTLLPEDFLGPAMETGLIAPMTWWALEEACGRILDWQNRFPRAGRPVYVSVNLTAQQFTRPDLVDRVDRALDAAGLAAGSLHLEVTEEVFMDHLEEVSRTLARLRDLGVRLSLDDFGTGYSSLASLRRLPIGTLKIDRSFVQSMDGRAPSLEIVRTILSLAGNLDLETVAEGVETSAQLGSLVELGCDCAQGFLFARPLAPDAAEEMLAAQLRRHLRLLA